MEYLAPPFYVSPHFVNRLANLVLKSDNRVKKIAGGTTTTYLVDDRNPTGYAQVIEPYTPTKAREMPRKIYAGLASRLRTMRKLAYIRLNRQTPCPPRGAVPVNQGCCRRLFHSQQPDRLRSWRRPSQLCRLFLPMCLDAGNFQNVIRSKSPATHFARKEIKILNSELFVFQPLRLFEIRRIKALR